MMNVRWLITALFLILSLSSISAQRYSAQGPDDRDIRIIYGLLNEHMPSTAYEKVDSATLGQFDTIHVNWVFPNEAIHLFHYFGDSTVTFSFASAGAWYHLTNATDSLFIQAENDGFTVSNDTITVLMAGDYDLRANLSLIGSNQKTSAVRFYNVTQTSAIPTAGATTALGTPDVVGIKVEAYAEFEAGDKVVLQIKQDATSDVVLKSGIIKMFLLHL